MKSPGIRWGFSHEIARSWNKFGAHELSYIIHLQIDRRHAIASDGAWP
jgi:hypothetical protein